ncbi:MAG: LacI family transcriptional regulator [Allobaculum sp.]|nr:LacI family transcriptional regulator [Allobaculum sp.]
MAVTMKDIATHSGWSLGTVSKVLAKKPGVSSQAKEEILQTAQRLGYQKNEVASLLRQKHPHGIVLIVRAQYCPAYSRLALTLKQKLMAKGYSVRWIEVEYDEDEIQKALALQRVQPAALLVFFGARRDVFRKQEGRTLGPALSIGSEMRGLNFPWLSSYFWPFSEMSQQATEWLFETHCKHIGVVMEERFLSDELSDFLLGIQYGFYSRNQVFRVKDQVAIKPFSLQGGYEGLMELKAKMNHLDGILLFNSQQALGALRAAHDLNLRIPEDLSILIWDQDQWGGYTIPSLSSFMINEEEDLLEILNMVEKLAHPENLFITPLHKEASWTMTWRESLRPLKTSKVKEKCFDSR